MMILLIETGQNQVLFRHPFPNTLFTPSFITIIGDEGDLGTLSACHDVVEYYENKLQDRVMEVMGLYFKFNFFHTQDIKLQVNCFSTTGSSSTYNCVRCFVDGSKIAEYSSDIQQRTVNKKTKQ